MVHFNQFFDTSHRALQGEVPCVKCETPESQLLNLLPYPLRQPEWMHCPSLSCQEREPSRQPWCGQTGDHLCQHPELTRMDPSGPGEDSGTVRRHDVLRVW
jgi:hypothetical protein